MIACVIDGTTDPDKITREKTRRTLLHSQALRARIEQSRIVDEEGTTAFKIEESRFSSVITKLAQGHALHELHVSCYEEPTTIAYIPLANMSEDERNAFEHPSASTIGPEVGSRMLERLVTKGGWLGSNPWIVVQPEQYRYHASLKDGVHIRFVIQEYLACHVFWADDV